MQDYPKKILLIEDDIQDIDLIQEYLAKSKHFEVALESADSLGTGLERLKEGEIDLVLCDLSLPDECGLDTFRQLYAQFPAVPIIILSGLDDEELAVTALSEGAQDYLIKGLFNARQLTRAIRYACERQQLRIELKQQAELLEQRVLERTAELQQAKEALAVALAQEKELSELKSRIITTVSHEYRTPLTTIASSAELLENYRHKWDEAKQLKHFQRIRDTVKHMTNLVNDVLFLNQAEFEKLECKPVPLDLVTFFQEIIDEQQLVVGDKHDLIFTSSGEDGEVLGDVKLLRQICTNLIDNAIKYSPDGGTVSLHLILEKTRVIFSCLDQGIGIPVEDQQKLFKSFSRASNVGTIGGTGLGLSIVQKCVDLCGGEIVVDSEVGAGTKFTVMLPRKSF
ncbi:MAG: hybrid sensor histidine kinase/response regulator [Coleofasciculus sp. S288]|nr:hybrid sensor histidine kinase/response regulator [Coleofasciculus sp. S288]